MEYEINQAAQGHYTVSDCRLRKHVLLQGLSFGCKGVVSVSQMVLWKYQVLPPVHIYTQIHTSNSENCQSTGTCSDTHWKAFPVGAHLKKIFLFFLFSLTHRPRNGLTSISALACMHKGTRAETFAALQVRQTESVIISVEYSDFCIEPSHKNLGLLM